MIGGYNVYKGLPYQHGYGLGDSFRSFFRWIIPIVSKHAMPALKEVGSTALSTAADIAKDAVSGKNLKEAASEHVNAAIDKIKARTEEKLLLGKGIKRSRKRSKKPKYLLIKKNKKQLEDIFN